MNLLNRISEALDESDSPLKESDGWKVEYEEWLRSEFLKQDPNARQGILKNEGVASLEALVSSSLKKSFVDEWYDPIREWASDT